MKKATILISLLLCCIAFTSCTKDIKDIEESNKATSQATSEDKSTTKAITEKTTALPKKDSENGKKLKTAVSRSLSNKDKAEISGELEYGKFIYKYNRDAAIVYANERNEKSEKLATDNAEKFAKAIAKFYKDNLKLHKTDTKQIGTGENGIDSVQYQFYYINSQNQLLTIYADSDGEISYADCKFTW